MLITREFDAPLETVWQAFTDHTILDQWWAPEPYKGETKSMNFSEGGFWHYCMVSPEGQRHWCIVFYLEIVPQKSFGARDNFCDENKVINSEMPSMHWTNVFESNGDGTVVKFILTFPTEADVNRILEMGFEQGFTMGLNQLERLLGK